MTVQSISHLVYSNAPGPGGTGFRVVLRPDHWPASDTQQLVEWVRNLHPAEQVSRGFGGAAFLIQGTLLAAVAVCETGFALDRGGRAGGVLTHVLLTDATGEAANANPSSDLLAMALRLRLPEMPNDQRLDAYLEMVGGIDRIEVGPSHIDGLNGLDDGLVQTVLQISERVTHPRRPPRESREQTFPGRNTADLAVDLAHAVTALPPRLRFHLRWTCGLLPGPAALLAATATESDDAAPLQPPNPVVGRYHRWLRDQRLDRPADAQDLLDDWEIRSWRDLERELSRLHRRRAARAGVAGAGIGGLLEDLPGTVADLVVVTGGEGAGKSRLVEACGEIWPPVDPEHHVWRHAGGSSAVVRVGERPLAVIEAPSADVSALIDTLQRTPGPLGSSLCGLILAIDLRQAEQATATATPAWHWLRALDRNVLARIPLLVLFTKADALRMAGADEDTPCFCPENEDPLKVAHRWLPELVHDAEQGTTRLRFDFVHAIVPDRTTGVLTEHRPCGLRSACRWLLGLDSEGGFFAGSRQRGADLLTHGVRWLTGKRPRLRGGMSGSFYRRELRAMRPSP